MTSLQIDTRTIGEGHPVLVIAELGVNHDGSAKRALDLVATAAACGADAVKLQVFRAATLMHVSAGFAEYQKHRGAAENPIDMLRRYELAGEDVRKIVQRIRELNMIPLATPFSVSDVQLLDMLRLPAVKIASPDLVNRPLLEKAAQLRKPLLLSTGAATLDEVQTTIGWLREWKVQFALLHCISAYPTPSDQANLRWIAELAEKFEVPIGYSDHTTSLLSGAVAAGLGACVIERHLTYDRNARGPDHAASSDPQQFSTYVKSIREAQNLRGSPGKQVLPIELDVRKVSRQSVVLRTGLRIGDMIRAEDLTVQRPGTGVPAAEIARCVGRRVSKPVPAGAILQWDMLDAA